MPEATGPAFRRAVIALSGGPSDAAIVRARVRAATLAAQLAELDRQLSAVLLAESGGDGGAGVRILISRKYAELEGELDQGALTALPSVPAV